MTRDELKLIVAAIGAAFDKLNENGTYLNWLKVKHPRVYLKLRHELVGLRVVK